MANDILALGTDEGVTATSTVAAPTKPRPVPELDETTAMALSFNGSPMAPDFFFSSARNKGTKSRKQFWKLTR
jgi:hypothetical protein